MGNSWKKPKDYAMEKGISTQAVYKKIEKNKLFSKVVAGQKYVSESPENEGCIEEEKVVNKEDVKQESIYRTKMELDNKLKLEKLKNMQADTALKEQKIALQKELMKREICEAVLSCYIDSFSDFKNELITLQLDADRLDKLNGVQKKCMERFRTMIKDYLKKEEVENIDGEEE